MDLPSLPPKVLEFLLVDSKLGGCLSEIRRFRRLEHNHDVQKLAIKVLEEVIRPYYARRGLEVTNAVYNFFVEPLKNANFHGGNKPSGDDRITFGIFLSPRAMVASYYDGGDYFRRAEVKEHWEARRFFREKHEIPENKDRKLGVGFGAGTGIVYDLSDFIYVDTQTGTLFTGLSRERGFLANTLIVGG